MVLYSFLQVVLESLPVSSSGHLMLFGLEVSDSLDHFLHLPTIGVLIAYFMPLLWCNRLVWWNNQKMVFWWLICLIIATIVTVPFFVAVKCLVAPYYPLWLGFLITALLFLSEPLHTYYAPITTGRAVMLGVAQGLAGLPGISRLGATYITSRWLGYDRALSFAISCALQVPLFMAGGLKGLYGLVQSGMVSQIMQPSYSLMLVLAMGGAYAALGVTHMLLVRGKGYIFGWYVLGMACFVLFKISG